MTRNETIVSKTDVGRIISKLLLNMLLFTDAIICGFAFVNNARLYTKCQWMP